MSGGGEGGGAGSGSPPPVPVPGAACHWERRYRDEGRLWGEGPSPLARVAVARLRAAAPDGPSPSVVEHLGPSVVELGCGYGRDSLYLAKELGCRVLAADPSPAAVAAAGELLAARAGSLPEGAGVSFVVAGAVELAVRAAASGELYDVVHACNVYHLLQPAERRAFAGACAALARPGGRLFLSTLAPADGQHYGVGRPVPGERRSWDEHVYLHFCDREELRRDFAPFSLDELTARTYTEHNPGAATHRHRSWFLAATRR